MRNFRDRSEAGEELSKHLEDKNKFDRIVVPFRNAHKVAKPVEDTLSLETDFRLSEYIYSPDSNVKIGAVVEDGTVWVDDGVQEKHRVRPAYIENQARIKSNSLKNKSDSMGERITVKGKNVLIVSDGVSDGYREAAVAGCLRKRGAKNVDLTAPFISQELKTDFSLVLDKVHFPFEQAEDIMNQTEKYLDNDPKKTSKSK